MDLWKSWISSSFNSVFYVKCLMVSLLFFLGVLFLHKVLLFLVLYHQILYMSGMQLYFTIDFDLWFYVVYCYLSKFNLFHFIPKMIHNNLLWKMSILLSSSSVVPTFGCYRSNALWIPCLVNFFSVKTDF